MFEGTFFNMKAICLRIKIVLQKEILFVKIELSFKQKNLGKKAICFKISVSYGLRLIFDGVGMKGLRLMQYWLI